jgi:ABC-type phosphate transport system substrate-binding protein
MKLSIAVASLIVLSGLNLGASGEGDTKAAKMKASDDIAVVVNTKNDVNELSLADLRQILLGERRFWKNRAPLMLVLREPGARERDRVLADSLKMSNAEFGRHWQDKVFRGEASAAPLALPSNGVASQYVVDTPGAITFVIGKSLRSDLKVLKLEGKLPGEPGYPLQ